MWDSFVAILRHRERQRFDMQCGFYVMCQICELLRALWRYQDLEHRFVHRHHIIPRTVPANFHLTRGLIRQDNWKQILWGWWEFLLSGAAVEDACASCVSSGDVPLCMEVFCSVDVCVCTVNQKWTVFKSECTERPKARGQLCLFHAERQSKDLSDHDTLGLTACRD